MMATEPRGSLRVGIDLDGVCYDFAASLRQHLIASGARQIDECPDPTRWEFYEDWGLSLDEFLDHCHDGAEVGTVFSWGEPFPYVREAFDAIKAAGHTIHIITDRSFGREGASEGSTRAWLDRHGLRFDSITFTSDKTIVKVDVMVDDKVAHYEAMTAAGVDTYLLTQSWNKAAQGAKRVLDLLHFAEVIG